MNKEKLSEYELTTSVHTFTVRSDAPPNIPDDMDVEIIRTTYQPKSGNWLTRVNPNKLGYGDLFAYKGGFTPVVRDLFNDLGIPGSTYYRVDLRLDSYKDTFKPYYKLNLLLVSLFAELLRDPNRQAIAHLLTQSKELTDVSTKNQYYEVKYYDKKYQKNDTDPTKARLEFRCLKSMRTTGLPPHEFKDELFRRLDGLPEHFEVLKQKCNKQLYAAYLKHCEYAGKTRVKADCATEFLSHYNIGLTIFDKRQLEQFFEMCDVTGARIKYRTDYVTQKCKMEFISKSELWAYIAKLKQTIQKFFSQ